MYKVMTIFGFVKTCIRVYKKAKGAYYKCCDICGSYQLTKCEEIHQQLSHFESESIVNFECRQCGAKAKCNEIWTI